jgi:copper transport protein
VARALCQLTTAFALALTLSGAMTALAHGLIERAEPPVGGATASAPTRVRIWFTEPIEPRFSRLEVYPAGSSSQIDLGDVKREGDRSLAVSLPPRLPDGAYIVVWQVLTLSDGHTTSGSYSFGVGVAAEPTQTLAAERSLFADAIRFLSLGGQAVLAGVAVFRWAIRLEDEKRFRRSLFWVMHSTRAALVLGLIGSLYVQSHSAGAPAVEVLTTRWGLVWLARAALIGVVAARSDWLMRGEGAGVSLLAGGLLLLTTSLTSHSAAKFGAAGVAADWAHLLATAVWSGGVLCTAIAIANRETKFLANFSILGTAAVGGLIASGLWLGNGQVGSWAALLLTGYGRALLTKLAVVVLAFGLGAFNLLRRGNRLSSAAEAVVMLIIILLAAFLTNLPPAFSQLTDGAPTRLEQSKDVGDLKATAAIWPARAGANTVEVSLSENGEPLTGATASLQFQPLDAGAIVSELALEEIGGGVYSASGTNLTTEGNWQILLTVNAADYVNFDFWIGPDRAVRAQGTRAGFAVQVVGWLNRYAAVAAAGLLLATAAGWSWLAWRSLQSLPPGRMTAALWLAPGMLIAGAIWLWLRLNF